MEAPVLAIVHKLMKDALSLPDEAEIRQYAKNPPAVFFSAIWINADFFPESVLGSCEKTLDHGRIHVPTVWKKEIRYLM